MEAGERSNYFDAFVNRQQSFDRQHCARCFATYDKDKDGYLNKNEFKVLLGDLFHDGTESYNVMEDIYEEFLSLLDQDQDGKLSKADFLGNCYYWLKQILNPVSALVIVDVQNDFLEGSLALRNCPAGQDGLSVIPAINSVLATVNFDLVVCTRDWHPKDHISFIDNVDKRSVHSSSQVKQCDARLYDTVIFNGPPPTEQKLWPSHCVQGSWGSQIHKELQLPENHVIVDKGKNSDVDSYSAFWDNNKSSQTDLVKILSKHKVTDVHLCGVAYDVCVGFTGMHSIEHGFRTIMIEDACRGVDLQDIEKMRINLQGKGAVLANSCKVKDFVESQDRHPTLGLQTAKNVALARTLVKEGKVKST